MVNTEIRLIIFFTAKDGETLFSQQKQDWELTVARIMNFLIAKFRFKLKEVWQTSRPFKYELNEIPHDYTVELTNRFKGLGLIDRVPEDLWTEVRGIVQDHSQEKEMQKGKMVV